MPIVISDDVVLTAEEIEAGVNDNNPRIGWHSVLTGSNVSSDEAETGYGVANIATPVTYQRWQGETTATQHVQVSLTAAETVNYFALAGHNLGSSGATIKLQKSTNGSTWNDVTTARVLASDFAFMEEFEDQFTQYYRLHMIPGSAPPQIAVLHIGRVLRMQRRLYVGHSPVTLNRQTTVSSGHSENGQFLGRVKRRQMIQGQANFRNIAPEWYRETFDPFVTAAEESAFFFAWRPGGYPNEVGYMWLNDDPEATNQLPNGMMSISMSMQGMR